MRTRNGAAGRVLQEEIQAPVTVEVVTLVDQVFGDHTIKYVRQADVLVANHGAGLTHSLFLDAPAHVIEMSCDLDHTRGVSLDPFLGGCRHHCKPMSHREISGIYWDMHVVSVIESVLRAYET
jgi:hypothetical protein